MLHTLPLRVDLSHHRPVREVPLHTCFVNTHHLWVSWPLSISGCVEYDVGMLRRRRGWSHRLKRWWDGGRSLVCYAICPAMCVHIVYSYFLSFWRFHAVIPGAVSGIIGIKDLAEKYWYLHALHIVTWVFVGAFSATVPILLIAVCSRVLKFAGFIVAILFMAYVIFTAYSDWMIGVVARNITGVPYQRVLAIIYFVASHFDLLFR